MAWEKVLREVKWHPTVWEVQSQLINSKILN